MAQILTNDLSGLERGFTTEIGGLTFTCKALNVLDSRSAWVKLQPMLRGLMAGEELSAKGSEELSPIVMAGITGTLNEETLNALSDKFAARCTVSSPLTDAQPLQDVPLSMKGILDSVFTGKFEEYLEWIDANIRFNFGAQISKQLGAVLKMMAGKAGATPPKAEPKELV